MYNWSIFNVVYEWFTIMDPYIAVITAMISFAVVISITTYKWFKES